MKSAVVYYSKTGNTKKVAEAIAAAVGTHAVNAGIHELAGSVDLLFIGGAVYGGKLDDALVRFIDSLTPEAVSRAVVFSTSIKGDTAATLIAETLRAQKIPVDNASFICRGRFLILQRKHPNSEDLEKAKAFAIAAASN